MQPKLGTSSGRRADREGTLWGMVSGKPRGRDVSRRKQLAVFMSSLSRSKRKEKNSQTEHHRGHGDLHWYRCSWVIRMKPD